MTWDEDGNYLCDHRSAMRIGCLRTAPVRSEFYCPNCHQGFSAVFIGECLHRVNDGLFHWWQVSEQAGSPYVERCTDCDCSVMRVEEMRDTVASEFHTWLRDGRREHLGPLQVWNS